MRRTTALLPALAVCLPMLAGCQLSTPLPRSHVDAVELVGFAGPPGFENAPLVLHGYESPGSPGAQHEGDVLLYGVRMVRGDWSYVEYVRFTKLDTWNILPAYNLIFDVDGRRRIGSATCQNIRVERFDAFGQPIATDDLVIPRIRSSASTLYHHARHREGEQSGNSDRDLDDTIACLTHLMMTIRGIEACSAFDDVIGRMRKSVVSVPWLDLLIPNWTISFNLEQMSTADVERPADMPAVLGTPRQLTMPVLLRQHELCKAELMLIDARPPYDLMGGMYRIIARHPERDDHTVTIQLLAGHHGSGDLVNNTVLRPSPPAP